MQIALGSRWSRGFLVRHREEWGVGRYRYEEECRESPSLFTIPCANMMYRFDGEAVVN